ncbi:MAG: hypothetical protein ABSE73_14740 [Planctomycetota bacterium]
MKPAPGPAESASAASGASAAKPAPQFIVFDCPNCDKRIGFPAQLADTVAVCSACRIRIMVPGNTDGESFVVCDNPPAKAAAPLPPNRVHEHLHLKPVIRPAGRPQGAKALGVVAACVALAGVALILFVAWRKSPVAKRGGTSGALVSPEASSRDAEQPSASAPGSPSSTVAGGADEPVRPLAPANGGAEPLAGAAAALPLSESQSASKPKSKDSSETAQAPVAAPRDEPAAAPSMAARPPTGPVELFNQPAARVSADRRADDDEPGPAELKKSSAPSGPGAPNAGKDAAAKAPDPPGLAAENPAAALRIAPRAGEPAARCAQCLGTGYLPIFPGHAYIHFAKDPIPNVLEAVPWGYCPKCQTKANPAQLIQAEAQRLRDDKAKANQQTYEQTSRLKFLRAETQHITLYMQVADAPQREGARPAVTKPGETRRVEERAHTELKEVAAALEQLKMHLELATRTTVLSQTRPDTHEMLILWDVPSYNIAIDGLLTQSSADDKVLARKAAGVNGRHRAFFNSYLGEPAIPRPTKHMALFMLGQMLMLEAIDGKTYPWLTEGFGAYCEHAVTKQNLCYSFEYELNEIHFGSNWDADMRRVARETKLKPWRQIFTLDLGGAKPADYLAFYSIVSFLMSDAPRFALFTLEVRNGSDCATALEKSYGRKLEDLQSMWANWVGR